MNTLRITARVALAATLVGVATAPVAEAAKKAPAKPVRSVANYCKAAKAWLAFENATLASGPYDVAWYESTKPLMIRLVDTAPTAIRKQTLTVAVQLVGDRREIAEIAGPLTEDDVYSLRLGATVLTTGQIIDHRAAVGAYVSKNCKIDVFAPFKALAQGFE